MTECAPALPWHRYMVCILKLARAHTGGASTLLDGSCTSTRAALGLHQGCTRAKQGLHDLTTKHCTASASTLGHGSCTANLTPVSTVSASTLQDHT